MTIYYAAAIDLGASSGRVMLASYHADQPHLELREIYRFSNKLEQKDQCFVWDLEHLEKEIIFGLNQIVQSDIPLHSIGIDTWGVDYVLLNQKGERLGPSYSYRDHRTDGVMSKLLQELGKESVYHKTGIQFLPFNTLYQFKAMMDAKPDWFDEVTDFMMIPDYLGYRLTGVIHREYTNATTSQMVNVHSKDWDADLLNHLGIPRRWFGTIQQPGNQTGCWTSATGSKIPVISVASHDTASAVISTPLASPQCAYLCSGTWSLMGLESHQAQTGETALAANITNEGGFNGTYRVLKNIMGLWLFQRICAEFDAQDVPRFIASAANEPAFRSLIQPNDERFINPESMSQAIQQYCREHQQWVPETPAQLARCIFDSLAMLYRQVALELSKLNQTPIQQLHVVGGGCQNEFLNQLCADICGFDVIAGPIEASTLGNVGCQFIALHQIENVEALRHLIQQSFPLKTFRPNPNAFEPDFLAQKWQDFCGLSKV